MDGIKESDPILFTGSIDDYGSQIFANTGTGSTICCKIKKDDNLSHCHSPFREEMNIDSKAHRKLVMATLICFVFMAVEIVGGVLANSLAIATDAAHLLTDIASFMISLFSLWYATRPATKQMNFGYYRAEVIGALSSVILIWVVTAILVFVAIQRLVSGKYDIESDYMIATAAFGICVNIVMAYCLHVGHSHGGHGHGHAHSMVDIENSDAHDKLSKSNINVRAALIHVIGDFIQSVGVLIASIIIYIKPEWTFIDPICTFLFSFLVLLTTYNIMTDVVNVLMEGMPRGIDFIEVQRTLINAPGVVRVHNLRIWSLSLDKIALSTHLAIDKSHDPTEVLKKASNLIRKKFDIFELTIQVEEYREEMKDCTQCQIPQ